jgi:glutamine---fructose-6-phosphate transaminase (isomerizing)
MEFEIRAQADLLPDLSRQYADSLKGFDPGGFEMVLLAARGSSDNAALYARYLIEVLLGVPVSLAAPSVITRFGSKIKYPRCLTIGISQSGAAPDVAEVLTYMRNAGHPTLAITNTAGSRLTDSAEYSLLLNAGKEEAVAATKTYTASLLALFHVVKRLGGDLNDPQLPDSSWIEQAHEAAQAGLGSVLRSQTLFALARGYDFCTAQESALKMMECALLACKSFSTADFEHGPKALAGHGSAAIVYGDAPASIEGQGCIVNLAPRFAKGPEDPVAEIIYGQWLSLLASRARGFDPDAPRFLNKVTLTL